MERNVIRKRNAFTLLEIVVVLLVIGVIGGVFIFRLGGVGDQNKMETARGDLRSIQTALNAYFLNHNSFPAQADWSDDLVNDDPRVLRQVVYDPFRSSTMPTEYAFNRSPAGAYYVVYSFGPNEIQDITGINDNGILTGQNVDDIYVTNGRNFS